MILSELIAKLEEAEEGSQELDALVIATLIGGTIQLSPFNGLWCIYRGERRNGEPALWQPSAGLETQWWGAYKTLGVTRSIDAALTLAPEGMEWHVSNRGQIGADHLCFAGLYGAPFVGSECDTNAKTPALALCIASLKARAS
jgi:hypothetical protein